MALSIARLNQMAAELIVSYSERYAAAHAEFAARNFPDNQIRRDGGYLRWKFRAPDSGPVPGLFLALRGTHVVGQVGLTPITLRCDGADFPAQWLSDFRVDPEFRLQGIGPMLVARAISGERTTIADAPTAQSKPVLRALGFQKLPGPQRMHLPLAPVRVASRLLQNTVMRNKPRLLPAAASLAPLYLAWRTRRLKLWKKSSGVTKCRWEELMDRIHKAQSKISIPHVVHDAAYLRWRSVRFGEGLGEMHGFTVPTGGYLLFGRHRLCFYVFDWAASSNEEARALFSAARAAGRRLGADSLSVLANTAAEQGWLQSFGFFTDRKPYELYGHAPQADSLAIGSLHCCHFDAHANL